jgi:hypothetical protein
MKWESAIEAGRRRISDIEEIHRSTNLSLLGMLSYKPGWSVRWEGEKEVRVSDSQANAMLRREFRKAWVYPEA